MDIQLPDISGLTVVRLLKDDETLSSIPIIAVTAFALEVTRDGQARRPETEHEVLLHRLFFLRRAHRIFKLAKPINTRMTVIIQKRTMTLGSAQPLSSK